MCKGLLASKLGETVDKSYCCSKVRATSTYGASHLFHLLMLQQASRKHSAWYLQAVRQGLTEWLMLQNMEDYQEDASGIQVFSQTGSLKYGLWINTTKNPRLKSVEFPQLGISLEVTHTSLELLH